MRHQVKGRKFNRIQGKRRAFIKGLEANLIMKGRIETTEARAKELKWKVDKLVTLGKKQTLHSLRLLTSRIPKLAAMKLYHEIAPKYTERKGGYTRIVKTAKFRKRDGVRVAVIEFV